MLRHVFLEGLAAGLGAYHGWVEEAATSGLGNASWDF